MSIAACISTVGWKIPLLTIQYFAMMMFPFAMSMVAVGRQLPPIHWNASNPMFMVSNTDHVVDVKLGDSIDIICPLYSNTSDKKTWEYYVLYMVKKSEYEDCIIYDTKNAFFLLNCSDPVRNASDPPFTLLLFGFGGIPFVPDFSKGQSYYIVSTSGGSVHEMRNQYLGACRDRNMKMKINVCCSNDTSNTTGTAHQTTTGSIQGSSNQNGVQTGSGLSGTTKPFVRPTRPPPRQTTMRRQTTTPRTPPPVKTTQKIYYPDTDPNKNTPKDNSIIDDKVIHANGPKNVGLISDSERGSGAVHSFSVLLVTLSVTLSALLSR